MKFKVQNFRLQPCFASKLSLRSSYLDTVFFVTKNSDSKLRQWQSVRKKVSLICPALSQSLSNHTLHREEMLSTLCDSALRWYYYTLSDCHYPSLNALPVGPQKHSCVQIHSAYLLTSFDWLLFPPPLWRRSSPSILLLPFPTRLPGCLHKIYSLSKKH